MSNKLIGRTGCEDRLALAARYLQTVYGIDHHVALLGRREYLYLTADLLQTIWDLRVENACLARTGKDTEHHDAPNTEVA